ncbi:MAG TPA: T9SS type A sorting domain-containing protein [Bacteroidia bacterium]|nr:T9SS type A sorting domain-containing protein [Bacteroidia bacterium]
MKSATKWGIIGMAFLITTHVNNGYAQNAATPNPGFENWTQVGNRFDPNNWNTLNPNTGIVGVLTCVRATGADVHSGTYGIKLTTKSVFGITANGIASTATLITTPPYGVTGGIPYTQRPDSIVGWYKCNPANTSDSGFVQFVLLGSANDTIGFVRHYTPNTPVGTYTRFSAPINYFSSGTPALSYWILSSSNPVTPVVNSSIIFDDIDLIFNPSGINEIGTASPLQIVNTIFNEEIEVKNSSGKSAELLLFDASGKLVWNKNIQTGTEKFNLQQINGGLYFYKFLQSGLNEPVYGKLIKL